MSVHRINAVAVATLLIATITAPAKAADTIDFNRDIRPILADKCFKCHGPDENARQAELRLDVEDQAFAKRDKATIVRGKSDASELIRRITSTDADERMPPADSKKTLTKQQIELLTKWVEQGAKWALHWAYVKPKRHQPPTIDGAKDWAKNAIDRFVLKRIRDAKLKASKDADRVTLIRRLNFDLIGLPPTAAEVEAFVNDKSPQAYERLVDRLLKSEHFGERMAIYWLDVVRYADSNGYHSDEPRQIAPYRDYVIKSFNRNKPYDQFIVEQLAGDLLPEATTEHKIASGFNMLLQTTSEGGAQAKEYLAKYAADRVRNTSAIFLGSTMGCAECHDHKFDPFTTKDFYSFAAFFADIQQRGVGNPTAYPVVTDEFEGRVKQFDAQIVEQRKRLAASTPELVAAQNKWEAEVAAQADASAVLSAWHKIGPFKAANFDEAHAKAFIPEKGVDLDKEYSGQKWQKAEQFVDGKVHQLSGENSATYLYRTITAPRAMKQEFSLGSDDSLVVWLNGTKVFDKKVLRGVAPDQDKVAVQLKPGENKLLMKVANGGGGYGFYFRVGKVGLPSNVIAILKVPADKRTDAQKSELANYYRSIAPALKSIRDEIAKLDAEKKKVQQAAPKTLMTVSVKPQMVRVLPRGNWLDDSGPIVQPATPEFMKPLGIEGRRANRLDLAKWIVDKDNPLTARTMVNRLWKLFFGQGLAHPLDDLGRQGTLPTHPELLDWLSVEFMESGWNVKHMVKLLVSSRAYQQTSRVTAELQERDPYNQLYARQARFRLDAEIVRDNALAVSGLLDRTIGGRSVKPYQPAGYWRHMNFPVRRWQADMGANQYRRGLYTWWQRMFLHPSMLAFDAPSREECTVERPRSNTPQQALVLLNDPTYVEAARTFAERIASEGGKDVRAKLNWAYRQALSRDIQPQEAAILTAIFEKHLKTYKADTEAAKKLLAVGSKPMDSGVDVAELAAWTSISRVILNLHETITRS